MTPAVIELRQYTLKPGRRDAFIALFEREFVETQEAVGIRLIGLFRDLDDPDRFVWLRGFADMAARKLALETFYFGPVWAEHRAAANAEIVDSDDVLLLAAAGAGFPSVDNPDVSRNDVILAGVHRLTDPPAADLDQQIRASLTAAGLRPLAVLATESAENTFPRLPVRTDGPFAVWFAFADEGTQAAMALDGRDFAGRVGPRLQTLRLAPTPRSRLQGRPIGG
ncbi:MAG: NIPSNAP family protein [Brevundimonas sp.]|nr:MAG: NIPSNAP family protein [Brevundimonas sp.]